MKKLTLSLFAFVLLFSYLARAVDLDFTSGNYYANSDVFVDREERIKQKEYFQIVKRGSMLTIYDAKNDIRYPLDLNSKTEYLVNPKYLQILSNGTSNLAKVGAAQLVSSIVISDLEQTSEDKISGKVTFNIKYESLFGSLTGKIRAGVSLATVKCEKILPFNPELAGKTCLKTYVGFLPRIAELKTSFPEPLNSALGLGLDISLRLLSPLFVGGDSLIIMEKR